MRTTSASLGHQSCHGELHRAGVLTSTTLMATGPAFDDAVAIEELPCARCRLPRGAHRRHSCLASLRYSNAAGSDGKTFRPNLLDFVQALLRGDVREDDIEREAAAQVQKLQRAGIDVTHIDPLKHTHLFTAVAQPLLHLAERCSVGAIRNPYEPRWSMRLHHGPLVRMLQMQVLERMKPRIFRLPQLHHGRVLTPDGTIGISATGNLYAETLRQVLQALPVGSDAVFELCCHPGYNDRDLDAIATRLRDSRNKEQRPCSPLFPQYCDKPIRRY